MQKHILFLCVALLITGLAGGQAGAEYILDLAGEGRTESASSLLADTLSGDVLVAASGQCSPNIYNCAVLKRLSPEGETRWTFSLGAPQRAYHLAALQRSDAHSYLAAGGVEYFADLTANPLLLRLDASTGDTLWQRTYTHPRYQRFVDVTQGPDGSIYLLSAGENPLGYGRMGLLKTTAHGDTLWWLDFDVVSPAGDWLIRSQNLSWATDTSLVVAGQFTALVSNTWETCFFLIDTTGRSALVPYQLISPISTAKRYDRAFTRSSRIWPHPTLRHFYNTGSRALNGALGETTGNNYFMVSYVAVDATVQTQPWEYRILRPTPHEIKDAWLAANGDLLVSGQREDETGERYGWLFRISPTGELVWERSYRSVAPHHYHLGFSELAEAADGRLWALGTLVSPAPGGDFSGINPDTWLVSLDANGCFTPGCAQEYVVLTPVREPTAPALRTAWLRAWPNPAPDALHVELLHTPPAGARLRLFNWQGQEVSRPDLEAGTSTLTIDLAQLPAGLYLLSLEAEGRVLHTQKVVKA